MIQRVMSVTSDRRRPTFERTSKPWFGPKKRAKELLERHREAVLPAGQEALDALLRVLSGAAHGIQHVRFIDFKMNGAYRYTIAICWTVSDPTVRDLIYEQAAECVASTGWYPLPQGERLWSAANGRRYHGVDELPAVTNGELATVQAAADGADAGTAVRVTFTDGASMLLDAGFGRAAFRRESDRLALITHHHRDHIGGVESGALDGLPIGLPAASAAGLDAQGRLSPIAQRCDLRLIMPERIYSLGRRVNASAFAVPHMPGSVGYIIDDGVRTLLYTGDIALRSARHNVSQALVDAIPEGRRATVLVDATMAGRTEGASFSDPSEWVRHALQNRDVAVVAHHDHLLYAYLDIFHKMKSGTDRNSVSLVVTERVRPLFQVLHDAFIHRRLEALDPFLAGQYGTSMSAWGESRWLYWHGPQGMTPKGRRVWFLTPDELATAILPDGTAVLTVGRVEAIGMVRPENVDTTPWTGHSDQAALTECVQQLEAAGHAVILFHNFRRRISKYAKGHGLAAQPLRFEPQSL